MMEGETIGRKKNLCAKRNKQLRRKKENKKDKMMKRQHKNR